MSEVDKLEARVASVLAWRHLTPAQREAALAEKRRLAEQNRLAVEELEKANLEETHEGRMTAESPDGNHFRDLALKNLDGFERRRCPTCRRGRGCYSVVSLIALALRRMELKAELGNCELEDLPEFLRYFAPELKPLAPEKQADLELVCSAEAPSRKVQEALTKYESDAEFQQALRRWRALHPKKELRQLMIEQNVRKARKHPERRFELSFSTADLYSSWEFDKEWERQEREERESGK